MTAASTVTVPSTFPWASLHHKAFRVLGVEIVSYCAVAKYAHGRMTMRYAHLAPENVRAAVTRLEYSQSRFGHVEECEEVKLSG